MRHPYVCGQRVIESFKAYDCCVAFTYVCSFGRSTLIVSPANQLPAVALRKGCPVVMINFDVTQYDDYVTAMIRQPAGEFLAKVTQRLEAGSAAEL